MNASTNTLRTSPSRRSGLLLVTLIAALLAAFALVLTVSQNAARAQETTTVEVNANQATWTGTGINLPAGSRVGITASGTVDLANNVTSPDPGKAGSPGFDAVTPEGVPSTDPVYQDQSVIGNLVDRDLKVGALIGRIGSGDPFKVEESKWIDEVTTAGELQLIVNDSYFQNNSGNFTAKVRVYDPDATDATSPRVIGTVPGNGATGVAPDANIKATFSEDMKASTINDKTFMLFKNGSTTKLSATVSYNAGTDKAKLNPTNNLRRGVTYKAVVTTGAEDLAGNQLDQRRGLSGLQPKVWHFKVSN